MQDSAAPGPFRPRWPWRRSASAPVITGGRLDDRQVLITAFDAHIDALKQALPPERVLFFDVSDGWPALCDFLERPIPDTPFPRSNSRDEFWETFGRDLAL